MTLIKNNVLKEFPRLSLFFYVKNISVNYDLNQVNDNKLTS